MELKTQYECEFTPFLLNGLAENPAREESEANFARRHL